jgi:NAD(P)-dependent dehydrogenase (short-subunit alcohol dehydrogenase family)
MQLNEVNAVVTGGASGLGLAVANRIVHGGGEVAIFDLSVAAGNAAAAALGERAMFIAADVSDEAAVDGAIQQAHSSMGSITAAINCAGIATPGRLVGRNGPMTGSSFRKMIEMNLLGTVSEFAALIVQILENVMLNGETIRLDGAVRMQPR